MLLKIYKKVWWEREMVRAEGRVKEKWKFKLIKRKLFITFVYLNNDFCENLCVAYDIICATATLYKRMYT